MKMLIWKEWREKRRWLFMFTALIIAVPLISQTGLSFGGDISTTSHWIFILVLPGLLLGLSTFAKEMSYECQDFILSRAISWKKILGAKILVDNFIILLAVTIGTVVFWLMAPSDYIAMIGIERVLFGALITYGVALLGYLPGFGASVILPGMLGSGFALYMIQNVVGVEAALLINYGSHESALYGLAASWILAVVITAIIMTKHGLGLTAKERVIKYGKYVFAISTLLLVMLVPLANHIYHQYYVKTDRPYTLETDISPNGKYLLCNMHKVPDEESETYANPRGTYYPFLIQLKDNRSIKINIISEYDLLRNYHWVGDKSIVLNPGVDPENKTSYVKLQVNDFGEIKKTYSTPLPLNRLMISALTLTPKSRYAAVSGTQKNSATELGHSSNINNNDKYSICIVDLSHMKTIKTINTDKDEICGLRWKSEDLLVAAITTGSQKSKIKYLLYIQVSPNGKVAITKIKRPLNAK